MSIDSASWIEELEEALTVGTDRKFLQKMCHQKQVPETLRPHLWQTYLGIRDSKVMLEEFFDLNEQPLIRSDCMRIVKSCHEDTGSEQLEIAGDIESMITTLCKDLDVAYSSNNGWIDLMQPLLSLKMSKHETFGILNAIVTRFLPRISTREQSFHLLRLLILYHDPELCSFLDSKKIHPETYACSWFRSLFAARCSLDVTLVLWDAYFLLSDPFLMFFVALVLLINSRDQILEMKDCQTEAIVSVIANIPKALEVEDISDLLTLIETHYCAHTSCLSYLNHLIFSSPSDENSTSGVTTDLAHALCLPVQPKDVIPRPEQGVKYFVIDCRSPDQYNSGHLSTAFHLDCSLMLQDKTAFEIAVDALLTVQKQAIDANSVAGGNHLCFMGSGRNEEDSYVYMVVASFLQKNYKFVSLCTGGFDALHDLLRRKHQENFLADHDPLKCSCCQSRSSSSLSSRDSDSIGSRFYFRESDSGQSTSIFDKFSSAVKSKTSEVKGKLAEFVASRDKYKGLSLFDDTNDEFNFDDIVDEVDIEVNVDHWASEQEAIAVFVCKEINQDHTLHESFLVLTHTHIFILRESSSRKGYAKVVAKRPLEMIVQITSKRKIPEVITFKYGETNESSSSGPNIIATDSLYFQKPYDVTRLVKQQVIKVLDANLTGSSPDFTDRPKPSS